jgi:hypothetical protein
MGFCSDRSTQFLTDLGYNVVRHPSAAIEPLQLIAVRGRAAAIAGRLEQLLMPGTAVAVPEVRRDAPAADIEGLTSATMRYGIGGALLANFVAALGGGVLSVDLQRETGIRFRYREVLTDWTAPLEAGRFLAAAPIDGANPLVAAHILGQGDLYLITRTVKSRSFAVEFEERSAGEGEADFRGAGPAVRVSRESARSVVFEGDTPVVFGFQCFRLGLQEGRVSLAPARAGSVAAAAGAGGPELLARHGLLELGPVQEL